MFKSLFKPVLALALCVGLIGTVTADDAVKPDTVLKTTVDQLSKDISANHVVYKADKGKFYKMVDEVVVPRFDTAFITQIVLGPAYRTATDDQKARFTDAFKNMLVRAYADAMLDNYDSVKIEWLPVRMAPNADSATVQTKLQRADGNQYGINFLVHKLDTDWKIYDISVEGISLVTSFKAQINGEIKKSSLDAVIQKMEQGQLIKPKVDAKAS
jgi:phospholipid transport system substrate-binding protein